MMISNEGLITFRMLIQRVKLLRKAQASGKLCRWSRDEAARQERHILASLLFIATAGRKGGGHNRGNCGCSLCGW